MLYGHKVQDNYKDTLVGHDKDEFGESSFVQHREVKFRKEVWSADKPDNHTVKKSSKHKTYNDTGDNWQWKAEHDRVEESVTETLTGLGGPKKKAAIGRKEKDAKDGK